MDLKELYAINKREYMMVSYPVVIDDARGIKNLTEPITRTVVDLFDFEGNTLAHKDYGTECTKKTSEIMREFAAECGRTAELERYVKWAQDNHHTGLTWDEIPTAPAPERLRWRSIWGDSPYYEATKADYKASRNDALWGLR